MSSDTHYPIKSDVLCFHNKTCSGDQRSCNLPYHRHNVYEIYLFLSGNVNLYIEQSCYQLIPGDLFLINPEQLHRSVCLDAQPYDRVIINISRDKLKKLSSSRTDLSSCFDGKTPEYVMHAHLSGEYRNYYQNLTEQLHSSLSQSDFGCDILSDSYLVQLLVFIHKYFIRPASQNERNIMPELVSRVMEYISEHLTEPISLSLLSQNFYMSGTYISSQFKRQTGLTLRTYILDQRIELAKRLLWEGHNVSEACYQSGFADYANFIRSFTKLTGVSPRTYARQHLQYKCR